MNTILPNLYISDDELEIIDLLVDNGQMPLAFTKDQSICFLQNNNFILVLFFTSKDDRGFQLFEVSDFKENRETMYQLAISLEIFIKEGFNPKIINQAKGMIREYMLGD
jgi:hypothetical protein